MRVIKTTDGREILLPKNDFLFKLIFGDERNKKLLESFLHAVLQFADDEFDVEFDVEFLDPHLKREFKDDKLCILDIRLRTKSGKHLEIELQVAETANIFERICYYKAEMLAGQLRKGDWYDNVKKVISITIADFNFIEGGDS
ncbi:MAG: Rpn family recombination-promoting nuclease/putative transposase, partial [Spirochaetaceae bacterium]|nr:Rpn family recombination-promoting nuclease/putative transposase [Spirochaetaceae bacterium]